MSLIYRHFFSKFKKLEGGASPQIYDVLRRFFRVFDTSVHTERTRNGDVLETPVSNVAVQVRQKGRYIGETFLKRDDARRWVTEGRIDRGETPTPSRAARLRTFGELIDLHIENMKSVDVPLSFHPAATRVLGLVTPRSVG